MNRQEKVWRFLWTRTERLLLGLNTLIEIALIVGIPWLIVSLIGDACGYNVPDLWDLLGWNE